MRKLIFILFMLTIPGWSQAISVTATITDSDSQTWNYGTWAVQLIAAPGANYNGTAISTAPQTGNLSSSGALAVTLYSTSTISPNGAQYRWTLCSQTSAPCSSFLSSVTTGNLSALLSGMVAAPRFFASPSAFGYLDAEITVTPPPGGQYYNVTNAINRVWNGTAWQNGSGGSAYNPGSVAVTGGTINGTPIGGTVPAAVAGTSITGTSYVQGATTLYPTVRGTLTLTTATSDVATVPGVSSTSVCILSPTNSVAAALTTLAYISAVSANAVTVAHAGTVANNGVLNILCTLN